MVIAFAAMACAALFISCEYVDEKSDNSAVSLLAGMPAEGDGVPEPRKAATQCGYLWPNQYLDRGEEVYSCSRNARLVHQSDGNVVLYGPSGFIWTTWTNGRATTRFIMQRDGNLVLYNGGTPLWNSGTWGNNYAVLAIQDDCNMVIYTNTTPRRAIWAASWNNPYFKFCTPPTNNVDVLSYMRNTSGRKVSCRFY